MLEFYIKYSWIVLCSLYIYFKILKLNITKKDVASYMILSSLFPILLCGTLLNVKPYLVPISIFISLAYCALHTKLKQHLLISTTIISFGISFIFYYAAVFLVGTVFSLGSVKYTDISYIYATLCTGCIQWLLSYSLFKIHRLKSGMPFLTQKGNSGVGLLIGLILISCYICSSNADSLTSHFFIIPIVFVLFNSVWFFAWWRNCLTKNYLKELQSNEFQQLQNTLQKQKDEIQNLQQCNDKLSKIIHKDNKLIPAMELAVKEYLEQSELQNQSELQRKGHMLLADLQSISSERASTIRNCNSYNEKLPATGILQIDSLLRYMHCKAQEAHIQFEFTLFASMQYLTENIICSSDLRTILADLLENAIIAIRNSNSNSKQILVTLGMTNQSYEIDIFDSGIPFERKTIFRLGQKNNTTHAADGGSGIGLPTVLETLQYYKASFYIQEFHNENNVFTKKVSIKFDGLNQCIVQTDSNEFINIIPTVHYVDVQTNQKLIS